MDHSTGGVAAAMVRVVDLARAGATQAELEEAIMRMVEAFIDAAVEVGLVERKKTLPGGRRDATLQ